ncbi:MAG TPA: bifunctional DNA-formamidopyrimidine glycosylase/DNA-(apurinic or apyrimidinic site) lyase [Gemmatimonadaceae bacterium]|jgi:formamidopyrimidine-DNA glycosylase
MPELPEVESAVARLREAVVGKTIRQITLLHPALQRRLAPAVLRTLQNARIVRVDRRGKHQLMSLEDGRVIHAHFRMTGDWSVSRATDELPRHARAAMEFTDGSRVVLEDPRMLSTLDLHPAGVEIDLGLGPEPGDPSLTAESFYAVLSKKRGPIKPTLLDQSVIAGLGNIYAAESLWHSKISPTKSAASLSLAEVRSLLESIRKVIETATGARYTDDSVANLAVYDHVGKPCPRCGTPIERIAQAGRSTYFCPYCQRDGEVKTPVKTSAAKDAKKTKPQKKTSIAKKPAEKKRVPSGKSAKSAGKSSKRSVATTRQSKSAPAKATRAKSTRSPKTSRSAKSKVSRGLRSRRP